MPRIQIKRVYDPPSDQDGLRILVDRLWPRGLAREEIKLDAWAKELAPSAELRRWFAHEPARFDDFAARYRRELDARPEALSDFLASLDRRRRLTLLYAARDSRINHAVVLREVLEERL